MSTRNILKPWQQRPAGKKAGVIQSGNLNCVFASVASAFNELFNANLNDTQLKTQYQVFSNGDLCGVCELAKSLTANANKSTYCWYHDRDSKKAADHISKIQTSLQNGAALVISLQYEQAGTKSGWHMITVTRSQSTNYYDIWDSGRGYGKISKNDLHDLLSNDKVAIDCNGSGTLMVSHDAHECLLIHP